MTDELQRQALIRDIARQLALLGTDAGRVVDRAARRLVLRHQAFGPLDLARLDDWQRWRGRPDERVDEALLTIAEEIAVEDRQRAEVREAAREEMVPRIAAPPPVPAEVWAERDRLLAIPVVAIGTTSIMDAPPDLKSRALDQMEQECRRLTIESERDFELEQHLTPGDVEEPIGVQVPDWDFEGGGQ